MALAFADTGRTVCGLIQVAWPPLWAEVLARRFIADHR